MKYRGQGLLIEILIGLIIVIFIITTAPTIATAFNTGTANTTLFPRDGPAYLVGGLMPFVWFSLAIIVILLIVSGRNQQGG